MIRLFTSSIPVVCLSIMATWAACGGQMDPHELYSGPNPFLKYQGEWVEDTGYINLRGQELHVTLEGDVQASEWQILSAPAELAQFTLMNLKNRYSFYLELLAEDTTAPEKVEWLVDGEWLNKQAAERVDQSKLKHFRMREINAVVMNSDYRSIQAGKVYDAVVPRKPYSIMEDAEDKCADYNSHISLSQSTYWYLWNPGKSGCPEELSQTMTVTIDQLLPDNPESYPEYDQLWADNKLTVAVFFGSLDDGEITEDTNYKYFTKFCEWLEEAGFSETSEPPPEGELPGIRKFSKTAGELSEQVSVIGPHLFKGVNDWGNFDTWQEVVSSHEIIHYDGHSQMGSGMVFERVDYPDFYQVFQVTSCLSYEYYVRPILAGKRTWDSVDVLSNVKSTYYNEGLPLVGSFLAKLFWGFENRGQASWQDIMQAVSNELGHARFGVSGARGNCFHPDGNLCDNTQPERKRYSNATPAGIPDDDPNGVSSTIQVPDQLEVRNLSIEVDITHSYVGDLKLAVSHNGTTHTLWNQEGGSGDDLKKTFRTDAFNGQDGGGDWTLHISDRAARDTGTLNSWTLVVTPADGGGTQPGELRFENSTRSDIPDNDSSGVISQIQVSDTQTVGSLKVELDIRHSYIGDLTVTLTHEGVSYALWDKSGGGNDDIRQSFEPTVFDGLQAQGTWQLHIADHANLDQGSLNSWALILTPSH